MVKARSSNRETDDKVKPGRSGVENPITPVNRTTGTIGVLLRNRAGMSRSKNWRTCSPEISAIKVPQLLLNRCFRYTTLTETQCECGPRKRGRIHQIVRPGANMAIKIYVLILLLGTIATFAHISALQGRSAAKPERLG
ncbi:hypothetical protein [Pseudorhodoplanes sp.]|uniref:hypothetical protein n=1 Tax=Pseudorhodoplanes sp. TaxID=1934341 RepID=UPI002CD88C2C|nr:hypothetical protein [Pseudorhodoplanes sp.]HWV40580.1 hypothetical protein [Pseudorhodoplanes sp.]